MWPAAVLQHPPTDPNTTARLCADVLIEKLDFPLLLTCVFGCFLQVVGMDSYQRLLSRGGSAGEGQGSLPGGPEGPEGRLGVTKGLGRKLPGECRRDQR